MCGIDRKSCDHVHMLTQSKKIAIEPSPPASPSNYYSYSNDNDDYECGSKTGDASLFILNGVCIFCVLFGGLILAGAYFRALPHGKTQDGSLPKHEH